jgi:7-cyano-7-deazaguanine synthase in queuosine biosynthesis
VTLGGELIECEADAFASLLNVVTEQVQHHNKTSIERGDYLPAAINAQGASRWVELESQIAPHRNTGMLSLAVFLAQREDADKKEEAE